MGASQELRSLFRVATFPKSKSKSKGGSLVADQLS